MRNQDTTREDNTEKTIQKKDKSENRGREVQNRKVK